jgi:clan AA aspartic protease (TIGR02281 family)
LGSAEETPPAYAAALEKARFEVKKDARGRYTGICSINGKATNFMADTGADGVAIPGPIAQRLGLKLGAAGQSNTAGGVTPAYKTSLDILALGKIELRKVPAYILPKGQQDFILLGMAVLSPLDMKIEQGSMVLTGESAPPPGAGLNFPLDKLFKRGTRECMGPDKKITRETLACLRGE